MESGDAKFPDDKAEQYALPLDWLPWLPAGPPLVR